LERCREQADPGDKESPFPALPLLVAILSLVALRRRNR
jgi:hypothetical protein